MKPYWLFVSYLPLGVNMMLIDEADWRWAQPMYVAAAIGITLAIGCLLLMTSEPNNASRTVRRNAENSRSAADRRAADAARQVQELVPVMSMGFQGGSP